MEVLLNMEGQRKPYHLSGVITGIEESRSRSRAILLHITLNQKQDGDTSLWKKLFH